MKHLNTSVTVQNTDAGLWLVTVDFADKGNGEFMRFATHLPKGEQTLPQLQRQAMQQVHLVIGDMLASATNT